MTIIDATCVSRDTNIYVRPKPIVHDQKVTIHHWQLRDLLLCDDENHKNELIVPTGQDIFRVCSSMCQWNNMDTHCLLFSIISKPDNEVIF